MLYNKDVKERVCSKCGYTEDFNRDLPHQQKSGDLSKGRGYQPSRHGVCEGGIIENAAILLDTDTRHGGSQLTALQHA